MDQKNIIADEFIRCKFDFLDEDFLEGLKTQTQRNSRKSGNFTGSGKQSPEKIENEGKIFKDEEGKIWAADQMLLPLNK